MVYRKKFKSVPEWEEVSYEEALRTVLGTYKDNDEVRSMLTIGNYIHCMYSDIQVFDDNGNTAKSGQYCLIP